jgi:hypothetical protein
MELVLETLANLPIAVEYGELFLESAQPIIEAAIKYGGEVMDLVEDTSRIYDGFKLLNQVVDSVSKSDSPPGSGEKRETGSRERNTTMPTNIRPVPDIARGIDNDKPISKRIVPDNIERGHDHHDDVRASERKKQKKTYLGDHGNELGTPRQGTNLRGIFGATLDPNGSRGIQQRTTRAFSFLRSSTAGVPSSL